MANFQAVDQLMRDANITEGDALLLLATSVHLPCDGAAGWRTDIRSRQEVGDPMPIKVIPGVQYSIPRGWTNPNKNDAYLVTSGAGADRCYEVMRASGPLHGQRFRAGADFFQDAVRFYDRRNTDQDNNQYGARKTARELAAEIGCDPSQVDGGAPETVDSMIAAVLDGVSIPSETEAAESLARFKAATGDRDPDLVIAPTLPPCGTCGGELVSAAIDHAMAGWCERCQNWGIGALELERHTEGFKFWDRFEVAFRDADPVQVREIVKVPAGRLPVATTDATRTKLIGEFLLHLDNSGVHLAEWAGGGIEPRVSSELARERLQEVIADFLSRS